MYVCRVDQSIEQSRYPRFACVSNVASSSSTKSLLCQFILAPRDEPRDVLVRNLGRTHSSHDEIRPPHGSLEQSVLSQRVLSLRRID